MVRKDYILRMIEELVGLIHQLVGLRSEQNYPAALALLEGSYRRLTGLDGDLLRHAALERLPELLSFAGEIDLGRCVAAAELLKEDGDLQIALGEEQVAYGCYDRALYLFVLMIERNGPMLLGTRLARIDGLADAIGGYALPAATGWRLFNYYRLTHRYADAEAWLFRSLAIDQENQAMLHAGMSFLERLAERNERELHAGGTSHAEIADSLAELRSRL